MKKILLFLSIAFLPVESIFADITPNQMVNIAGKQRMLSQKIAKIYLMQAYGANLTELKSELDISKMIFERNLETLTQKSEQMFTSKVSKAVLKEKICWNEFKWIISKPVDEKNIDRIMDLSNILLKNSDDVVTAIKRENLDKFSTNTELLNVLDKSGKQRMLSQRLCLYFVAKKFDLKNKIRNLRNDTALYSLYNDLDEELLNLLNSEVNTTDVENAIGNAMITFENLRTQEKAFINGIASLNIVYNTTNQLTKDFDHLTFKYSQLKFNETDFISAR